MTSVIGITMEKESLEMRWTSTTYCSFWHFLSFRAHPVDGLAIGIADVAEAR